MEFFSTLFVDVLKLSPFVGALLYFLFTVWNTMQKKDEALTTTMKEHSTAMIQMAEKNITALNNSADSNRQLSGSIDQLCVHLTDNHKEVMDELRNGKTIRLNSRKLISDTPQAQA